MWNYEDNGYDLWPNSMEGETHWNLRSNPTWRARQTCFFLQGWQIYIGVLILLLKGSTRCEFFCLTGHPYMDVQLLGQTQRSIVEWIVHKTRILNNYLTKERKVKGRPPINQIGHKIRNFPRTWRIQLVLHTSSVQGWKSANKIFFETDLRRGKGVYLSEKGFLFSLYSTWNQTEKATSG